MDLPSNWKLENNKLVREITLNNFVEVISLVNKIAELAEEQNHHPDLEIYNYKNLKIKTTTHDTGGLTEKDYKLAELINNVILN